MNTIYIFITVFALVLNNNFSKQKPLHYAINKIRIH